MLRRIAFAVLLAVVVGNYATWSLARDAVSHRLLSDTESLVADDIRAHDPRAPIPKVDIILDHTIPILPGVLYVAYTPTVDGHAPCMHKAALMLWYGLGATTLFRTS
jgi:hypothetical protein